MNKIQRLFDQLRVRGCILFGLYDQAVEVLSAMILRDPSDPYAHNSRAQVRMLLKQTDLALIDLKAACAATPDSAFNASHAWYNLGYLLNEQGSVVDAESAFRKSLSLNSALDLSWYGLGLVLIQQRRFDEAVEALKKNTHLQPMSPFGWYQLARVHMDRKSPEEAVIVIKHLRGFDPKVADQLVRETGLVA